MGWCSSLKIGEHSWNWRNLLPRHVPIIFYGKHEYVGKEHIEELRNDDTLECFSFIGIESNVKDIKENLDKIGLSLDFFNSFYDGHRDSLLPYIEGSYSVIIEGGEHHSNKARTQPLEDYEYEWIERAEAAKKALKILEKRNPIVELKETVEFLKTDTPYELENHNFTVSIPSIFDPSFENQLVDNGHVRVGLVGFFIESIKRQFPEIGDLFEIRLVLESSKPDDKILLDLEDVFRRNLGGDEVIEIAKLTIKSKVFGYKLAFDYFSLNGVISPKEFLRSKIARLYRNLEAPNLKKHEKGKVLEEFISTLFTGVNGMEISSVNLKLETQELDIVVKNKSENRFFISLSAQFIFIECKNWNSKTETKEIRVFESKLRGSITKLGIFVSFNGFTKGCYTHTESLRRDGITIILISKSQIDNLLLDTDFDVEKWLENIIENQVVRSR